MQEQHSHTQQKRSRFPWRRAIATLLVSCVLSTAAILLLLSIGHVIAAYWLVVIPVIFTVIGLIIPLVQWLFPIAPQLASDPPALPSTPIEVKLSLTPSLAEPAAQIENQGPVQGQNIAHYQQIMQYFGSTGGAPAHPPRPERIWSVPYRRNPFFTGREEVLNRLHEHFTRANTAALTQPPAITGLGGIGKTQVAVEYAYRYRDEYHAVLWVNAATRETLIDGFLSIARWLALPAKDEQNQRLVVAAVQHWSRGANGARSSLLHSNSRFPKWVRLDNSFSSLDCRGECQCPILCHSGWERFVLPHPASAAKNG